MHFALKHNTTQSRARARIEQGLMQAGPQLQGQVEELQKEWQGNTLHFSFKAQGHKISGTCEVTEQEFVINAKLPLMWRLFEGRIEKMLQEEIAKRTG